MSAFAIFVCFVLFVRSFDVLFLLAVLSVCYWFDFRCVGALGSFNVGNSPLTDLAPWLPYGGKGFDLIVIGLQESTYKVNKTALI